MIERLENLLDRLAKYDPWEVLFELAVIWVVVYLVVRFVQGTRAAGAAKGMLLVIVLATLLARLFGTFPRLTFLYDGFLAIIAVALVVVFQPELRRGLIRLGEAPIFRATPVEIAQVINEIVEACAYLAKARFGAIIVIERHIGLKGLVEEAGTPINAEVSARLLQTIFYPGAALHDLAVVIRGRVLDSAGVQLPMVDPMDMPDPSLGARHRAAVGMSRECDALVVVVSEETGAIRVAERGTLSQPLSPDELRTELRTRMRGETSAGALTAADAKEAQQVMEPEDSTGRGAA